MSAVNTSSPTSQFPTPQEFSGGRGKEKLAFGVIGDRMIHDQDAFYYFVEIDDSMPAAGYEAFDALRRSAVIKPVESSDIRREATANADSAHDSVAMSAAATELAQSSDDTLRGMKLEQAGIDTSDQAPAVEAPVQQYPDLMDQGRIADFPAQEAQPNAAPAPREPNNPEMMDGIYRMLAEARGEKLEDSNV